MSIQIIIIVLILIVIFYFFGKNFGEAEETAQTITVKEDIPVQAEEIPAEEPLKANIVAVIRPNDTIESLWKYGTEPEWKNALVRYYDKLSADIRELDKSIENLNADEIKNLSVEEFFMFLHDEYFVWKYIDKRHLSVTRKNLVKYVSEDNLAELADVHKRLFEIDFNDIRKCFKTAGEIKGLSLSGASCLLSVLFPEKFGAVDKYTANVLIRVFGEEDLSIDPENLKLGDAVLLEEIIRDKAEELNKKFNTDFWTPRKIDMILWSTEK